MSFVYIGLLTIHPRVTSEYSNSTVAITCYFSRSRCSDSNPQWSGPAVELGHATITVTNGVSQLVIKSIQEEDEGQYHCSCGGMTTTSTLLIYRKS